MKNERKKMTSDKSKKINENETDIENEYDKLWWNMTENDMKMKYCSMILWNG